MLYSIKSYVLPDLSTPARAMNSILPDIQPRALVAPMTPEKLSRTLRACAMPPFSIQELSKYTQDVQHDVKPFEKCIQRLRSRQAALQRDIARYNSPFPIRKLPIKILRRILALVCGGHLDSNPERVPTYVFRLSGVRYWWREIALQSPELWANLMFDLDIAPAALARLAIARSRQHPLSLQLFGGWTRSVGLKIWRLLLEHAARWSYIDLLGVTLAFEAEVLFSLIDDLMLETIVCTGYHTDDVLRVLSGVARG
ncbi:hypothetical protein V5O48_012361 [Marasmius crinis-equi]|uniref:F-box domain-containing protein n=1 Tax=Marasmius crinis-equi TaxID=585013 RepID=A0ABR3F3B9_9AGAR